MVTFTAAMLQTRQTAVFLHLLSKLDSFTPTACLLASYPDCLPLLHVVLCLAVPTSPPANHNIHAVSHDSLLSVRLSAAFSSRPSSKYGDEFHSRRHNESLCLTSTPPCRLHFRRRLSIISFVQLRCRPSLHSASRTPLSSITSHILVIFLEFIYCPTTISTTITSS
jgi:hypothetical protein